MILKHVLIGGFFTFVGLVSLLLPAVPFICIGALILGPIELLFGLTGDVPNTASTIASPIGEANPAFPGNQTRMCPRCGLRSDLTVTFCTHCGQQLTRPS